jgi:hypothetical protein
MNSPILEKLSKKFKEDVLKFLRHEENSYMSNVSKFIENSNFKVSLKLNLEIDFNGINVDNYNPHYLYLPIIKTILNALIIEKEIEISKLIEESELPADED